MQTLPSKTAFRNARSSPNSAWDKADSRLAPEAWPDIQPSFRLETGSKIFAIGSCFARNIEEHLSRLGYDVPTLRFTAPREETGAPRANAILNKYTPAAIWQESEWAGSIFDRDGVVTEQDCERFAFDVENKVIDTNLGGFVPVSRDRYIERRMQVYETWQHMFSAECVTLTLGLIEAWFDLEKQTYLQQAPGSRPFLRQSNRFEFRVLGFTDCARYVQDTINLIRRFNSAAKILITTSPVPLSRTFTGEDVITANMRAKSVLRAVCSEIVDANEATDYFPSYESVTLTHDWSIWNHDRRHVSDVFVGKIVSRLATTYFANADEASKLFQGAYTEHNDGNNEKARELVERALSKNADEPTWWRLAATVHRDLQNPGEARRCAETALRIEPDIAENHYVLATVQRLAGDSAAAIASAENAIERDPGKAHYHFLLGELLQESGDGDRALDAARTGLGLQPAYWRAHVRMADILEANGLADEALESAMEAMRRRRNNPWIHRRIAGLFVKLGQPESARAHADKASEFAPARRSFHRSLSSLAADIDRLEGNLPGSDTKRQTDERADEQG